jgi:crotonobetainyl-CoA:carnitine CoA-transferase CaiB-like acyl-CoA transferase
MKNDNVKKGALNGIRVLDLTRVLAGPYCTMLLGDMGAEIIKIEIPGVGDDTRSYPPFVGSESAYFMNLNRNKKSITLNLKNENGKKTFFDLVEKSDVVLENFRPGTMEKMGIGYDEIKKHNSNIVYTSISGFGHTGPYKDRPGYDIIGQAMGGTMSVTGWPGGAPTRTGTAIADILGGLNACIGILSGLLGRNNINSGQKIDIALVDSVVSSMETIMQIYLVENRIPTRTGNRYEFIYPYDSFEAEDGWIVIGIGNDKLWQGFCEAIGREELKEDERYLHNVDRVNNHEEVKQIVEDWTKKNKAKEIVEFLLNKGMPCAPIYSVNDIVEDEHIVKAREMIQEVNHPVAGSTKLISSAIKMSETPPTIETPAPLLGQHTEEILKDILSYSEDKIKELKDDNVF